jgi:site-specific recombinase XerD
MSNQICILPDGRRVRFSVKKRDRDPFYLVAFRGSQGRRLERSTKEENQRRAIDAASVIIKDEYSPRRLNTKISWEDALKLLEQHMRAGNLRQASIDHYKVNVGNLMRAFPKAKGPGEITADMAEQFKGLRLKTNAVDTVRGNMVSMKVIYRKWWIKTCKVLDVNPFAEVEKPKTDRRPPRIVASDERHVLLEWLSSNWSGWRLPILFLEVKWLVGCRITELASAPTEGLQGGRIRFVAETTKGRRQRTAKLPQAIFEELKRVAGKTYVFERYSEQLRAVHIKRGKTNHAQAVKQFTPGRLRSWIEGEAKRFFDVHPEMQHFKLHNFRGTAMSRARSAEVSYDDASVAFGCHPETMRKHYVVLDETSISDRVMDRIQSPPTSKSGEKNGEIPPSPPSQPTADEGLQE